MSGYGASPSRGTSEQALDLEAAGRAPGPRLPRAGAVRIGDRAVQIRERTPAAVVELHDFGGTIRRLEDTQKTAAADRDVRLEAGADDGIAGPQLVNGAGRRKRAAHTPHSAQAGEPDAIAFATGQERHIGVLHRNVPHVAPAKRDHLDVAGEDTAIGAQSFDQPNAFAGEDRGLDLPLGLVDALGGARVQIEQRDVRAVPGALGRLVGADRHGALAVPVDLEDVDALRPDLLGRASLDVDREEAAPGVERSLDLRILIFGALLLNLRGGLDSGPVGADVGGEHEQATAVRRPAQVFHGAVDAPDGTRLARPGAEEVHRHASGVVTVGGEGERAVRRPRGKRVGAAPAGRLAAGSAGVNRPDMALRALASLGVSRADREGDVRAVRRDGDGCRPPKLQELRRLEPGACLLLYGHSRTLLSNR